MNQFHFLRPDWFWLLPPLALLLFWLWRHQLRGRSWQAVCDPKLLPFLLLGRSQRRRNWPLHMILVALLLSTLALAGPTWEQRPQPLFRQQSALILLLDLSASMNATDLKPSRLVRARLKIADILHQRREGQTALVVFAGDAFTVTPLTDDSQTIEALLESLEPGLMPVLGSRPDLAIEQGRRLLQQAGLTHGDLLLITDDDQPEQAAPNAVKLKQDGYRLSIMGVGTTDGAPIPLPEGGFFKDNAGQVVLPRLNPNALQQLAQVGGGNYKTIRIDDRDIQSLLSAELREKINSETQQSDLLGDHWREAGVWLLWPLSLLAACAFRRGWLTIFIFCALLNQPAQAMDWKELWQRPDQRAAKTFAQEDYAAAAQEFEDKRWQSSAHYRNGNYDEAAKLLEQAESADDWYNQANSLAKSGRFQEAISAYNEALKLNPEDLDAQTNKALVEEALKQQEQSSQDGESGDESDSSEEKNSTNKEDSSSQEDQSSQENGEPSQENQSTADEAEKKQQKSTEASQENSEAPSQEEQLEESKPNSREDSETSKENNEQTRNARSEASNEQPATEEQRATQQWLQRIPDDPGGLLRRKFLHQYRQRDGRQTSDKPW